ncbi:hypothetical protein [Rhizobium tumorigenes]|uniref:Polymer-forming cytoskeletal protein n=1 Tax=Rhizobium tumorigenes TaxID=2041385 RepID=A0AAF1K561_9HYPH|nr:hypothetical protein [Rhizobium tumorigenes]WFR95984.1 hypothetical protein PR017_02195 [Rhizobium tumorigenes]
MNQHTGDFVVTGNAVIRNEITGVTYVKPGGNLVSRGRLSGGLIVEAGGNAVISGEVGRNLLNEGNLVLNGHVAGKLIGNGAVVMQSGATVGGNDLPLENVSQSSTT